MSLLPPGLGAPAAPTRASAAQAISILRTGGGDVNVNAAAAGNRHSAGSWRKASLPPPPQPAASVAALQALSDIHRRVSARALHVARTHDDDLYAAQQELDRTHEALADLRANVGAIARGDSMRMRMATSTAAALAGSPGRNLSLANEELEETATAAAGDDESSSEEECGDPAQQQPPLLPPHTGEKETTQALSAVVPGELVVSVRRATQLKELHYLSGMHPFCTCTVGTHYQRTSTRDGGGANPVWNESLHFYLSAADVVPVMHVEVLSEDHVLGAFGLPHNELIGFATVDLSRVLTPTATQTPPKAVSFVVSLVGKTHGHRKGEVVIEVQFLPGHLAGPIHRVLAAGHECDTDSQEDAVDDGSHDTLELLCGGRSIGTLDAASDPPSVQVMRGKGPTQVMEDVVLPRNLAGVVSVDKHGTRMRMHTRSGGTFTVGAHQVSKVESLLANPLDGLGFVRGMVSKKKRRFQEDGFDLDLTYITDQIVAMGFPSDYRDMEALYRNPMDEVVRLFKARHHNRFMVVNLCSERDYDPAEFEDAGGKVLRYGFDDHNPPPLELMEVFCREVAAFLALDQEHVVAVHCKAGKGRTGTLIACLLLHLQEHSSAADALKWFGYCRTSNGKGVTIPSQIRYVHYYERLLQAHANLPELRPIKFKGWRERAWLHSVHVHTCPHFDMDGGSDLFFVVKQSCEPRKRSSAEFGLVPKHQRNAQSTEIWLEPSSPIELCGDIKIEFWDEDFGGAEKCCVICFHVGMEPDLLALPRAEIDGAVKDKHCKHFDEDFHIELLLSSSPTSTSMQRSSTGRGFVCTVRPPATAGGAVLD